MSQDVAPLQYDVIVVGAGPAGAAAAKTCVSGGLRTLILERERLPRMRVADAAMYKPAQRHVHDVFGEIPARVLTGEPTHLRGGVWHEPVSTQTDCVMPWCWRSVLDHWMAEVAVEHGADLRQETRFTGFIREGSRYRVLAKRTDGTVLEVLADYLVGADGPTSKVRRLVRPDAKFDYLQQAQHHYRGRLDLERDLYHFFLHPEEQGLGKYAVTTKGELFAVSYAAHPGRLKELIAESFHFLSRFGFDPGTEPVWRGRCVEPMIGTQLSSHRFRPGRDNVLLVGDAGGFMVNVTLESIGPGIRSGTLAGQAIIEAHRSEARADDIYYEMIEPVLQAFGEADEYQARIDAAAAEQDYETMAALYRDVQSQAWLQAS